MLGKFGALWLFERLGVVALAGAVVAGLRRKWWLAVVVVVAWLVLTH
ncbi:MAG: hypothetical protein HOV83_21985 [Catenulispora sp.]|nr:hypothetical protein [Catenulispora sp.]